MITLGYIFTAVRAAWRKVRDLGMRRLIIQCLGEARTRNLFLDKCTLEQFAAQKLCDAGLHPPGGSVSPSPSRADTADPIKMPEWWKKKQWQPKHKGKGKGKGGSSPVNVTVNLADTPSKSSDHAKRKKKKKEKKKKKHHRS